LIDAYLHGKEMLYMQKKLMRRDFAKKSCAKIKGYKLITVWENDIRKKDSNSKDWILGKIREYELHESRTNFDF
jgi:G:T-mismatch repair DNA endonuclease (very short patch repair protein)